ncbi:hypothetical protein NW752_008535 [Fusarium irregulare]|uniref:Uncharacterized protein n=1 Tax=Fusarium irregulare TaxID=2494466 RepID=A0A9W8UC22_9HYPO|nr:hypothetical protein NW752_008535 [Fusarium irregulare]KAJ4020464.1 hypothetical protein NW766_001951 [Fusarium irregulare]
MAPPNKTLRVRGSIAGPLHFSLGIQETIDETEKTLGTLKGFMVAAQDSKDPFQDRPAMAGYDANDRNRMTALIRDINANGSQLRRLNQDISITKESMKLLEENACTGIDSADKEACERASCRVVKVLAESSENIQTLFRGMNISLTPAGIERVRMSFQQGTRPTDDQNALRTQIGKLATDLKEANGEIDRLKVASTDAQALQAQAETTAEESKRTAARARQDMRKAQDYATTRVLKYKAEIAALKQAIDQLTKAKKDLDDLVSKLNKDFLNERARFHSTLDSKNSAIESLESSLTAERKKHKEQLESVKAEKVALENDIEGLKAELQETNLKLEQATTNYTSKVNEVTTLKDSASEQKLDVAEKGRKILELEEACKIKDQTIVQRDDELNKQNIENRESRLRVSRQKEELDRMIRLFEGHKKSSEDKDSRITQLETTNKKQTEDTILLKKRQLETLAAKDRRIQELEGIAKEKDLDISKRDDMVKKQAEEISLLTSRHLEDLEARDRRITELEKTANDRDDTVTKRDVVVDMQREQIRQLEREQLEALAAKDRRIQELEQTSEQKDITITDRDDVIESQIQEAATFLGHLSVVRSSNLKLVAKEALVNSTRATLPKPQWVPWKILSWSDDDSLKVGQDDRAPEAIATQVLAVLGCEPLDTTGLLNLLWGLQTSLSSSSSMVSFMDTLLLRAFTSVGANVHLMHLLAMCQITYLLAPTDEVSRDFTQAIDNIDPRINRLVNALKDYTSDSPVFSMEDSVSTESLVLVGFRRNPRGIIAVELGDRQICWVDSAHITMTFDSLKLCYMNSSVCISIDSMEMSNWAMTHV